MPEARLAGPHARLAAGGVGLTTVAYGAVHPDGRTHEAQPWLREAALPAYRRLTDAVHRQGAAASIQLTHCGFFTRTRKLQAGQPLSPSRTFNEYGLMSGHPFSRAMKAEELAQTAGDFARAARLAQQAGFDAVELHMGHGYLLSQFLSPRINRRRDRYGGKLPNRLRFPLEVVAAVRAAVGEDMPILCKMNLSDGFRGGLQIAEAIEIARALEANGVDALVLSGGYTSRTPFYLMRGEVPLRAMIGVEPNYAQKAALAVFGRMIIRRYPFAENFFLPLARQIRQAVRMPLVYLGGVISGEGVKRIMAEGFELLALGRALIHDPDFVRKLQAQPAHRSACNHCNQCVAEMDRDGLRCVLN
jgi:2,4-dienoyl-CoA reductase-like NADH-dependent reductase (Old Yellow Enzyme family)